MVLLRKSQNYENGFKYVGSIPMIQLYNIKICLKQSQNFLQSVVPNALLNSECVQCVQKNKNNSLQKA